MKRRTLLGSIPAMMGSAGCLSGGTLLDGGHKTSTKHSAQAYGHATVTSEAFEQRDVLPKNYRCEGGESSPPLSFEYPYYSAGYDYRDETWAVVLQSSSYPRAPPQTSQTHVKPVTHWLLWSVPVERHSNGIPYGHLPTDIPAGKTVSSLDGATQGRNSFGTHRYDLGCPVSEQRLLWFDVFTLSDRLDVDIDIRPQKLIDEMYDTSLISVGSIQAILDPTSATQSN